MNDAMQTVLNAVSNASREPVTSAEIVAILATGDGAGHLVRALYGDCAFETLDRLGEDVGVSRTALRAGYENAKRRHAARNAELDEG